MSNNLVNMEPREKEIKKPGEEKEEKNKQTKAKRLFFRKAINTENKFQATKLD